MVTDTRKWLVSCLMWANVLAAAFIVLGAHFEARVVEAMVVSGYHDLHPIGLVLGPRKEDRVIREPPLQEAEISWMLLKGSQNWFLVVAVPAAILFSINALLLFAIVRWSRTDRSNVPPSDLGENPSDSCE